MRLNTPTAVAELVKTGHMVDMFAEDLRNTTTAWKGKDTQPGRLCHTLYYQQRSS
jgi:hypothetical protein